MVTKAAADALFILGVALGYFSVKLALGVMSPVHLACSAVGILGALETAQGSVGR